jgi:hypothetical protein
VRIIIYQQINDAERAEHKAAQLMRNSLDSCGRLLSEAGATKELLTAHDLLKNGSYAEAAKCFQRV